MSTCVKTLVNNFRGVSTGVSFSVNMLSTVVNRCQSTSLGQISLSQTATPALAPVAVSEQDPSTGGNVEQHDCGSSCFLAAIDQAERAHAVHASSVIVSAMKCISHSLLSAGVYVAY